MIVYFDPVVLIATAAVWFSCCVVLFALKRKRAAFVFGFMAGSWLLLGTLSEATRVWLSSHGR
jgi:hypothetical protein